MNWMKRFLVAGPGCQMPCPGVPKTAVPSTIIGTTSVASVSITLPSEVNVARAATRTGTEAVGLTGVKVSCQDPANDGRFAAWAATGSTADRLSPKDIHANKSFPLISPPYAPPFSHMEYYAILRGTRQRATASKTSS